MNREILTPILMGNEDAIAFVLDLWNVVCTWDDLVDKDKPRTDAEINAAFETALIDLPRNAFYAEHFNILNPLVASAILDWHTSNALNAAGGEQNVREAFHLRCSGYDIVTMSAKLIGGNELAIAANASLRTVQNEWPDYAKKHGVQ